jgi:hypothetical protein
MENQRIVLDEKYIFLYDSLLLKGSKKQSAFSGGNSDPSDVIM